MQETTNIASSEVYTVDGCDCVSNAKVFGLEDSIRGAKLPMSVEPCGLNSVLTGGIKNLAQSRCGEGHDQWLTGVIAQFDLTFTIKAWTEAERYHFFDFVSSQSTIHRLSKFDLDDAYNEYVDPRIVEIMQDKLKEYNKICEELLRASVLKVSEGCSIKERKSKLYLELLYSNPTGFKLTARMTTNYRQLKTIYFQRKAHTLPEWRSFCKWIETLPESELITQINDDRKE